MPKGKNKKYSKKQMKIARMAPPFDKITGADFAMLKKKKKKKSMKKTVKAPKGFHWMKKGNSYKLMKGAYKPHKGAVKMAKKHSQYRNRQADATVHIYLNNSVGMSCRRTRKLLK